MPLSGYSSTLPSEVLLNPAIVYVGTTVWGATRGGVSWDPAIEHAEIAFDGQHSTVKGLTRISKYAPKLTFTIIQLGTAAEILRLHPGATTATSTDTKITTVITPKDAGVLFATGDYLTDVRAVWELGAGTSYFAIYIPVAYVSKPSITGAADGEGEIPIELSACLDMTAGSIGDAPFKYEIRSALPA